VSDFDESGDGGDNRGRWNENMYVDGNDRLAP